MLLAYTRTHRPLLAAGAICLAFFFCLSFRPLYILTAQSVLAQRLSFEFHHLASPSTTSDLAQNRAAFWRSFSSIIEANRPQCDPLTHPEDTHLDIGYTPDEPSPERPDLLVMSSVQKKQMTKAHQLFVKEVQSVRNALPYTTGTRGLVTTAGGSYLPVAVVSLRMLRESGSQLPMEIFLASRAEWDPEICDKVFPSLNANCVVLQDIFDAAESPISISKYQYKVMSILLSSYEDVLFLDSDAFPIYNPDQLFDSEPFKSTGLVVWPDFWFPSESPLYFDIAGIEKPPVNARASAESGEILYSKSRHGASIMLATYYNFWGPDFYYPLLSQGAPGEGDKDTFIWAATALGESYYFVQSGIKALGYTTKAGDWRGSAMTQADPVLDYEQKVLSSAGAAEQGLQSARQVRPFFVHANYPKFDPATIFKPWAMGGPTPTKDSDGTLRRAWNNEKGTGIAESELGFDLERRFWTAIVKTACSGEGAFSAWQGQRGICRRVSEYCRAVFVDAKHDMLKLNITR